MSDDARALWDQEAATFDDAADHGLRDPLVRRAWRDLLMPLVGERGRRVADLGCGTGTLARLLAEEGAHRVTGIDISPEMVRRAVAKTTDIVPQPEFAVGDAFYPPLAPGAFDVVLSRHVLWAMPDPATALNRWINLLHADGALILIEGRWQTDVGLRADETTHMLRERRSDVRVHRLSDASYWGRAIEDERYLIFSPR